MQAVSQLRSEFEQTLASTLAHARAVGQHPSELRDALLGLQRAFAARLVNVRGDDIDDDSVWEFENRRLPDFVRAELGKYIRERDRARTVPSLFAVPDVPADAAPTERHSYHLSCQNCGAARMGDVDHYGPCAYCGARIV